MEAHAKFACVLKRGIPVLWKPEINIHDQLIHSLNSINPLETEDWFFYLFCWNFISTGAMLRQRCYIAKLLPRFSESEHKKSIIVQ
jgi:hypothetical protein